MIDPAHSVTFRKYQATDFDSIAALWTRVSRDDDEPRSLRNQVIPALVDREPALITMPTLSIRPRK
jgi:hypothetical protein